MYQSIRIARAIAAIAIVAVSTSVSAESGPSTTAERLYDTHCVSCHGPGGNLNPDSPVVQGLGVVPANFKDPLFNSREPGEDWEMVIEHGGAALGLSDKMPAFGDVLTEREIETLVHYLKA